MVASTFTASRRRQRDGRRSPEAASSTSRSSVARSNVGGRARVAVRCAADGPAGGLADTGGWSRIVAQISRRSQADSNLLAEILRSNGFYDALVEPDIQGTGADLNVVLNAEPGAQYRFASVELPGLDAAGADDAAKLRNVFAVKEGDRVRQGQTIGRIGATGRATGPHLHWSIKWRDARLDPILFTGPMR